MGERDDILLLAVVMTWRRRMMANASTRTLELLLPDEMKITLRPTTPETQGPVEEQEVCRRQGS